ADWADSCGPVSLTCHGRARQNGRQSCPRRRKQQSRCALGVVSSQSVMSTLFRFFFGVVLPLIAILIAAIAWSAMRRRNVPTAAEERIAALEEQVRGLLYRVWTLERGAAPAGEALVPAAPPASAPTVPILPAPPVEVLAPPPPPVVTPVARPSIDLEQRIGARWATWVGVVAILFAVGFFLK